jgi:hypothetical protein
MLLAAIATLAGATVQGATGFGLSLMLGPALFLVLEPREALTTLAALSATLNALMLFGEGRAREVVARDLWPLAPGALLGLPLGVLVLEALSKETLQVVVGVGVILAAAVQARPRRAAELLEPERAGAVAAGGTGLATGALTSSLNLNGPPLVLWLLRHGATAAQLRDSIAAVVLPLNLVAIGAVVAAAGPADALDATALALLAPVTVAGHYLGRRLYARIDPVTFRAVALALVAAAGAASVVAGAL